MRPALILLAILLPAAGEETPAAPQQNLQETPRRHWSFQPLRPVAPPPVAGAGWTRGPIDCFILARIEAAGLLPMPEADRATWMRRVCFDLTGLPPDPEDITAFESDPAPDARERCIDRLLGSRAYGERWAQHWLDLARFAETDGFEHDLLRPSAWRYRDWVIDALNRDMPYDEFVRLQIAGDELQPGDAGAAVATGFALCAPDMPDINSQEERRHVLLNDIAGAIGSVFLGLQMGCASCHDHKFDPISQAEFYSLRAFFDNSEVFKEQELAGAAPAPGARRPMARILHEMDSVPAPSHLMIRGDFTRPGAEAPPGFPSIANPWGDAADASGSAKTSRGRRTALARWLTRPDHPLATRAIANRIWQQHFGEGLTRTPSDLGLQGDRPSHPELLDWLAAELPRQGWSLKSLHRSILLSAAYGQASRPIDPRVLAADPDNRLLARFPRRRLEGEAIRDALLAAAGRLSPRSGGPGVMPPLPREILGTLLSGQWKADADPENHRLRSIYLFARRNLRYPLFEVFDRPDGQISCSRRDRSTTAPQALALLNSELSSGLAADFARSLEADGVSIPARIGSAYLRALGRRPSAEELDLAAGFLEAQEKRLAAEGRSGAAAAALADFCLSLFNLNEFIYVD